MDTSYAIPIACKLVYRDHPEVSFRPGPFNLGGGLFGRAVNWIAVLWVAFVSVIFCFPTMVPVTPLTMNYSSVIFVGVLIGSVAWFYLGAVRPLYCNLLDDDADLFCRIAVSGIYSVSVCC